MFRTILLLTSFLTAAFAEQHIKVSKEPYSKAETQKMVDDDLARFAKKKHGNLIKVQDDDDYAEGKGEFEDPLEPLNRCVFFVNGGLDIILFEPLAHIYRNIVPNKLKTGFDNFWDNLQSPLYAVNHLLQGEMDAFFQTTLSFTLNTLFGGLGLFDMAEGVGLKNHRAYFGQTLATWGMESGPYLVLPVVGSSTFRGTFGLLGDFMLDPIGMITKNTSRHSNRHKQQRNLYLALYGVSIIAEREKLIEFLEDIQKNAIDPYVAIRNAYYQKTKDMESKIKKSS